jgi:plasmid stabilization system protein ParE
MAKEVILTPRAIANYEKILEYLMYHWGLKVTNDFIDRLNESINMVAQYPERFPFENKIKPVQRCIVTKHNILYFKETPENIRVLTIFDTRQDPEKLSIIF